MYSKTLKDKTSADPERRPAPADVPIYHTGLKSILNSSLGGCAHFEMPDRAADISGKASQMFYNWTEAE